MTTLMIAVLAFFGYIVAYHTYGRWLAKRIFGLDPAAEVPSRQLRDNIDFVPTRKEVIFGHHFTSIAGTGPIVGPAIAVFWGWLPALLWVVFGSIFIGAVHDFSALVVSLRNRGQTVGEIAGRMIAPRAKILFLLILFFALTIVLAIFGLVIASIFKIYPESVLSVWLSLPIAIGVGLWVYKRGGGLLVPSLLALGMLYLAIYVGAYWWPVVLPASWGNPVIIWTVVLLIYCFVASVLPVWLLLQPRDFVNSHQLVVALVILVAGLAAAGLSGKADIVASTPMVVQQDEIPAGAPPILPFLFITVACGAVSGFHCLVSSGTTSKQVACETDAQYVGYGAMLLESALAVVVILACCAGVGMGKFDRIPVESPSGYDYQEATVEGQHLTGRQAWKTRYDPSQGWNGFGLGAKVGAFVEGGANFIASIGIPLKLAMGIMAVLVACFAATTLDTATRLQRYVIQELAATARIRPLTNKYAATLLAVVCGGAMAMLPGPSGPGSGGLILWPLFGAVNQLLAGLALMVTVFYLWRRRKPVWFIAGPMCLLLLMPAWAMLWQMFNAESGWLYLEQPNYLLLGMGGAIVALQIWMIVEGLLVCREAKGVLEEALPPLPATAAAIDGGRAC
ncbi:MAG TPA: carbon starvation protein A [Thermoguttaceae bacterium]|nr:carbon starvation protein A [Thermoguttaceae bacterium]